MERRKIFLSVALLLSLSSAAQCVEDGFLQKQLQESSIRKDHQKALTIFLPLQDRSRHCPSVSKQTYAHLLRRIGAAYYGLGLHVQALSWYRQYVHQLRQHAATRDEKKLLMGGYYWLSLIYDSLNMVSEKLKAMDSCMRISDQIGYVDRSSLSSVYGKLEYYYNIGDYYRSMDYAVKCEAMAKTYAVTAQGDEKISAYKYEFSSMLWRVNALLLLKDIGNAEKMLRNKLEQTKALGLDNYTGTIYEQLAEVELQKNNPSAALAFFRKALAMDERAGQFFNCRQILNTMASRVFFQHLKDPAAALQHYRKALQYKNSDPLLYPEDRFETGNVYGNMANAYVALSDWNAAFAFFEKAFGQLQPGADENTLLILHDTSWEGLSKIHYLLDLVIDKGAAFQKRFSFSKKPEDLSEAIRIYRIAGKLLDRLRPSHTTLESKLFWRSSSRRLYENAIASCFAQQNAVDAFYFFEKSKAVLLQDQLQEQSWYTEQQLLQRAALKKKIHELEGRFDSMEPGTVQFASLQNERLDLQLQLSRMLSSASLLNRDTEGPVSVAQLQQYLREQDQSFLTLYSGDSAVYLFYADGEQLRTKAISRKNFDGLVSPFLRFCSGTEAANRDFEGFARVSAALYRLIFSGLPAVKSRLVIVPDGIFFPVDALVTAYTDHEPQYLFLHHAVSYTYSAKFLLSRLPDQQQGRKTEFLGIAPVRYPAHPQFAALHNSDASLRRIAANFSSGTSFLRAAASRKAFLERFHAYEIIQLYTHSEATSDAGEPGIYFSDAPLYLSELVLERPLQTRFVFLSACETAKGKEFKGEGVFSLARGFAALGIPSSISMMWQVENEPTYQLTELFYRFIADGLTKDQALQKARIRFYSQADGAHQFPYYWAAPLLTGNTAPLVQHKDPWPLWSALLLVLAAAIFIFFRKRH